MDPKQSGKNIESISHLLSHLNGEVTTLEKVFRKLHVLRNLKNEHGGAGVISPHTTHQESDAIRRIDHLLKQYQSSYCANEVTEDRVMNPSRVKRGSKWKADRDVQSKLLPRCHRTRT